MSTIHVVGFSGSISPGALGIKPPVFERDGWYCSRDPERPSDRYDRSDIEDYQERGLLTLVGAPIPWIAGHVYVYAHREWVAPVGCLDLASHLAGFTWHESLVAHCAYMARLDAIALFGDLGRILVDDAARAFAAGDYGRAKATAMRARFAALPGLDTPTRQAAHRYVIAARIAMGEIVGGVVWHAKFDFGADVAARLETEARALCAGVQS